jgi:chromosome segregation ATPase
LVLTRSEKQKEVIELYNEGKTIRQIAQVVHMSFGDICSIIRRETGDDEEQNRIRLSKASQALKMFEEGNTPVQVAIKLDIETGEVDRLYKEYWKLNGLHKLNEIYKELGSNILSFAKLYQFTKKEGMMSHQVIDALKIAEEIPNLQAERQHIEDCIDEDWPKIFELKRQKESLANELKSLREHLEFVREDTYNNLKSMQEELDLANNGSKLEREKLDRQKATLASKYKEFLANEVATAQEHAIHRLNNSKECLLGLRDADNQLKFIQKEIDKLKREKHQLTSHIERLKNEERQHQPQLVYQQPLQQETPNLSEEEQRILAIPLTCNNWESKWGELMHHGWTR